MKERDINCDLMRVIAMLSVIALHVQGNCFPGEGLAGNILRTFFYVGNSLFFMISGRFNLDRTFETKEDYKNFYYKRFCTIFLPFLLFSFLLPLYECFQEHQLDHFLSVFINEFMITNNQGYLWFMYSLIGFIISTPFLSKAVHAMKNWELNIVFVIILIWNTCATFLSQDLKSGMTFPFNGWIFWGWIAYYFLGYYLKRTVTDNNRKWFVLGIAGFIITVGGVTLIPGHFVNAYDLQPGFILLSSEIYLFFEYTVKIKGNALKKGIRWIAKYSFYVYLVHMKVIVHITSRYLTASGYGLRYLLIVFIVTVISVVIGFTFDKLLVKPVQWLAGYRKSAR